MKLFISWSKELSRQHAECFRTWISRVFQDVEPFMSSQDIELGERGIPAIEKRLDEITFGVIFVTRENQNAPWIHYEAGALSRAISRPDSRVVPLLIDLEISDLAGSPLSNYQGKEISEKAIRELCKQINGLLEKKLDQTVLDETFDLWWSRLEECWSKISVPEQAHREVTLADISEDVSQLTKIVLSLKQSELEQNRALSVLVTASGYAQRNLLLSNRRNALSVSTEKVANYEEIAKALLAGRDPNELLAEEPAVNLDSPLAKLMLGILDKRDETSPRDDDDDDA